MNATASLVSLSTNAFAGQREALQSVLDGIADAPVQVVLTTGPPVDTSELTAPSNAEVHRFLPHDEVMGTCSAVIGHGGHSTTMRALAHGLPLVIMPMHPMLDQPMVGMAVEAAGAGVSIKRTSSPAEIRAALDTVLGGRIENPHRRSRRAGAAQTERWPPPTVSSACSGAGQSVTTARASSTSVGLSNRSQWMRGSLRNSRS